MYRSWLAWCCLMLSHMAQAESNVELRLESESVFKQGEGQHNAYLGMYENLQYKYLTADMAVFVNQNIELRADVYQAYAEWFVGDWSLMVGQKYHPWGYGLGFRTMDLFGRLDVVENINYGVVSAAAEYYWPQTTLTLMCAAGEQTEDWLLDHEGCAVRSYRWFDDFEIDGAAFAMFNGQVGAVVSGKWIANDALSLSTSGLITNKAKQPYPQLRFNPSMAIEDEIWSDITPGLEVSMGAQYTHRQHFVTAEWRWQNNRYNYADWDELVFDTLDQPGPHQQWLIAKNQWVYNYAPLTQNEVLVRWQAQLDSVAPALTGQFLLDGSVLLNTELSKELGKHFEVRLRHQWFLGLEGSLYDRAPEKHKLQLRWQANL